MRCPARIIAAFCRDRKAATAIEYGLIAALIVITAMIGVIALGGANSGAWGSLYDKVKAVSPQ